MSHVWIHPNYEEFLCYVVTKTFKHVTEPSNDVFWYLINFLWMSFTGKMKKIVKKIANGFLFYIIVYSESRLM